MLASASIVRALLAAGEVDRLSITLGPELVGGGAACSTTGPVRLTAGLSSHPDVEKRRAAPFSYKRLKEETMRKIIYWVHTSVDGFIDGPKGEFDWPVMGPELSGYSDRLDQQVDTLLFGRPVWEMMVGFWPNAESISDDAHVAAFAPFWRATPKIVFSRTYQGDEWTSRVIRTDLAEEVAALKAQPGADLLLTGGAGLAAALTELGLIDQYHIAVHPVVLGGGRQLFASPERRHNLRLIDSRTLDGQVVVSHYQPTTSRVD